MNIKATLMQIRNLRKTNHRDLLESKKIILDFFKYIYSSRLTMSFLNSFLLPLTVDFFVIYFKEALRMKLVSLKKRKFPGCCFSTQRCEGLISYLHDSAVTKKNSQGLLARCLYISKICIFTVKSSSLKR